MSPTSRLLVFLAPQMWSGLWQAVNRELTTQALRTRCLLDLATGTFCAVQTITTLPDSYTARNTCSQIHLASSGRFLYVANRGHNSIAGFAVDGTGRLTAIGHVSTEPVPSTFCLDPEGHFVFAAGTESGRLASYRINGETGALTPLATYAVGRRPMGVLATRLDD